MYIIFIQTKQKYQQTIFNDHRSGFKSTVLKGTLRNIIYKIDGEDPESKYRLEYGECKEGSERVIVQDNIVFKETCRFDTLEGSSYYMAHDVLHRIELTTPANHYAYGKRTFSKVCSSLCNR